MKKLTLIFLGLTLSLGMGSAFAKDSQESEITVNAPVFVPASGSEVAKGETITWTMDASCDEYRVGENVVAVAYVINGTDKQLNDLAEVDSLFKLIDDNAMGTDTYADGKVYMYDGEKGAPTLYHSATIKALQIVAIAGNEIKISLSSIVEATYKVDTAKLPTPAFKTPVAGSTVEAGAEITFDIPNTYDWDAYTDLAYFLYVENDADVKLEGTAAEIMGAVPSGAPDNAAKAGEPGYKVVSCWNDAASGDLVWTPKAVVETKSGALTIRARLVGITLDDKVFYSDEITVSCKVEAGSGPGDDPENPELPATVKAPVFVPAAGGVEEGQAISWTWDTAYEKYPLVTVAYVINGSDSLLDITVDNFGDLWDAYVAEDGAEEMAREEGVTYLYNAELPFKIEHMCTVKARLVIGTEKEGVRSLALSPIVEAAYTVWPAANEGEELAGVSVYPNPNAGTFSVAVPERARIDIFGLNGAKVLGREVNAGVESFSLEQSGIYFVRVMAGNKTAVKRVVVR